MFGRGLFLFIFPTTVFISCVYRFPPTFAHFAFGGSRHLLILHIWQNGQSDSKNENLKWEGENGVEEKWKETAKRPSFIIFHHFLPSIFFFLINNFYIFGSDQFFDLLYYFFFETDYLWSPNGNKSCQSMENAGWCLAQRQMFALNRPTIPCREMFSPCACHPASHQIPSPTSIIRCAPQHSNSAFSSCSSLGFSSAFC